MNRLEYFVMSPLTVLNISCNFYKNLLFAGMQYAHLSNESCCRLLIQAVSHDEWFLDRYLR